MTCPECKREATSLEPVLRKVRERRHVVIQMCVVCRAVERNKE
jgi:hypothetical protein